MYVCMYIGIILYIHIQYIWTVLILCTVLYFNREANTDWIKDYTFSNTYTFIEVLHTDTCIFP